MFSNLHQGSQIYVLYKSSTPSVEVGVVESITKPRPNLALPMQFGQAPEYVLDIVARVGARTETFQILPASLEVAESSENVVVATNRESMNAEVMAYKQKSLDIINSVEYHKAVVAGCDKILESINPEYAQQAEIASLKAQMAELMALLKEGKKTSSGTKNN